MTKKPVASEARTHLLKMRTLLRAEAAALMKAQATHQKGLKAQLERLIKRLDSESDGALLSELSAVRDELASVRRGMARLAIAEQSTNKLKNEWHDWMRHAEKSRGEDHALRTERLEMLSSELRMRGIEVPYSAVLERPSEQDQATPIEVRVEEDTAVPEQTLEIVDEAQDEERSSWNEVGEYWEQLIAGLHPDHADPVQLARLLRAFRNVQGERKREDRRHGVRRYRLTAFEAWS